MLNADHVVTSNSTGTFLRLPAVQQMAIDATLLRRAHATSHIVFRTYAMTPSAVTIGSHQHWARVIDEAACTASGWDWCRRPTGGGALLHQDEINYAIIAPRGLLWPVGEHEFRAVFDLIGHAMTTTLIEMGFNPTLNMGHRRERTPQQGLCGRSITGNEIAIHDLKIVAAAQRISAAGILQHGTIYLKAPPVHERFWPVTSTDPDDMTQRWADLGARFSEFPRDQVASQFECRFRAHMPVESRPFRPEASDWQEIESTVRQWVMDGWNRSR